MSSSSYPIASTSRDSSLAGSAHASSSSTARDSKAPSLPSSHMESTITRLLVATKALLEGLAQWSKGEATEDNISAIYVKLGNDFNVACAAFAKEGIMMTELLSVPADLRACLELCLSDAPSQAALERHLPKVRQIIIRLLTGLREKQKQYRDGVAARRTREASERESATSAGGEQLRASQREIGVGGAPITPNGAKKSAEDLRRFVSQTQASTSTSLPPSRSSSTSQVVPPVLTTSTSRYELSDAPAPAYPRQPSPSLQPGGLPSGPRLRNSTSDRRTASSDDRTSSSSISSGPPPPAKLVQSRSSTSLRDSSRSSRSTDGGSQFVGGPRVRAFSPPPPPSHDDDEPVPPTPTGIYLQSVDSAPIALRPPSEQSFSSSMQSFLTSNDTFSPTIEASQSAAQLESLEALKSADSLVRRASKRYSAYAIQKMTTDTNASPSRSTSGDLGSMAKGGGKAEGSRSVSAGRELAQNGEDKRGSAGGRRMKSEFRPGRGPDGERRVIPPLPTASPGFGRTVPTISEESSPRMSLVEESSSSRETLPKDDGVATFESTSAPPLPSADPSAAPPPSSSLDSSLPNSRLPEPDPEPDSDYPISVYLQVGRDVKKAQLDEPPTIAALRVLFIERFQYNPGHADFPSIYIRDPLVGVQYELEDLSEVRNLSVLSLNIDTVEQVKHHIDQGLSTLAQDIKELRSTVVAMRRASVPALSPFAPAPQTSPPPSCPSERQFQDAAQTILKSKRALSIVEPPADSSPAPSPSLAGVAAEVDKASTPASPTPSVDVKVVGALKQQHEEVQNLRREVGILRQVYVDFATQTKGVFATLRAQTSHVQNLAATKVSTSRAFIDAGKAKLEKESTDLIVKGDDLQDAIDQMRSDISLKSIDPRPAQVADIASTLAKVIQSRDDLVSWIATVKPSWKATWSDELQTIINEQQLLEGQETLLSELEADLTDAAKVFETIKQVVKRPRGASRALREFVPTPAEEGGGLATVLLEVRGLQPDANRRLEAIARAERTREVQKSTQTDEFADELDGFVSGGRLRKSGGVEETERLRQAKSEATLRSMFAGGAVEPVRPPLPSQTKSSSSIASVGSLPC